MEPDQPPTLKGVVIISLPPADNPSLGKTITAFTLTDSNYPLSTQQQQLHQIQPLPSPSPPPQLQNPQAQVFTPRLFLPSPRKLLGFLGISVFVFLAYSSLASSTFQGFKVSEDDGKETKSFLFPLYHKYGIRGVSRLDMDHSLRRFVVKKNFVAAAVGSGDAENCFSGPQNLNKLVSSTVVATDSSSLLPIRGNVYPDGLYFTYMLVGNPPRPYFLDVDTGSDLTWIQCDAPCMSCAKGANALYKPRRGNIVPPKDSLCMEIRKRQKELYCETCQQCDYEIEYADHSSSMGVLAKDELHLKISNGSLIKSNFVFGCAYDQQGLLLTTLARTDGILGLNRAKVSLPSQLASQGIIKNVMGHCLTKDVDGGGYMFFGDDFVPRWGMAWVPMIDSLSQEFYRTEIVRLKYGNSLLSLGGQDSRAGIVIFDTGSSYTYFTKEAYSELLASLKEVSQAGLILDTSDSTLPYCWRARFPIRSVADVKQIFKTLTLQFESKWRIISTKLQIPPEGYLIINNKGNVCLGILDGSKVHDGSAFILGDISLRGQLIVYDNVNMKIGWAPSDCVKPETFQSLPFFEG